MLERLTSKCRPNDTKIVSRDKGATVRHVALNEKGSNTVRQYQLDGELVKNQTCCDFLLLNDTKVNAYFIELKGSDIKRGIEQLDETAKMLRAELINYTFYYRLVSSKVNTHDVKSSEYRKFKEKHYPFFEHKNREIVDIL